MRNDSEHRHDTEHSRPRSHRPERKRAAKRALKHDPDDDHHEGLEPKLTIEELKKHRTFIFKGPDGREYQSELPGSWTNAKVAAEASEKVCQECRDSPHFDTEGYGTNRELGRRIQEAFTELKAGKGFVMAWRIYPDKDHPRWQIADGCGCGCGGGIAEDPKPAPKATRRKPGRKVQKPTRR